jgi:hypothetical protein
MLIAASAVLLALGLLAYRRQFGARENIPLLLLRLVVLVLLGLVLIGSVIRFGWTERPRRVVVLCDQSQSITTLGLDTTAWRVASGFPLAQRLARQVWEFADSARPAAGVSGTGSSPDSAAGFDARTRIARAMELATETRPAALVVVSDGQDNGGSDARQVAARSGVPVYAVGVGQAALRNAAVTDVVLPAVVKAGESTDLRVRLRASGFSGELAEIRLLGRSQRVALPAGPAELEARFRVVFESPGRTLLSADVDSMPGEASYEDNRLTVSIAVGGARLRVGYLADRLGAQTRFVMVALASDSAVQLDRLAVASGAAGRPKWLDSLDVLVLDDPVEDAGSAELMEAVAARVEAGAGLLVVAGPQLRTGSSLDRLLGTGLLPGNWKPEPLQLTAAGRVLPWFGQEADAIHLDSVPPFAGYRLLSAIPAGAEVWSQTASGRPAMVARRVGKGRVVYVAGYPLWRWGFVGTVGIGRATSLQVFLSGVIRYLAEPDSQRFRLATSRATYLAGEPVSLVLRAVAPDGRPWSGLDVLASAIADSGGRETRAVMVETEAGVYEAEFAGLDPGAYSASAAVSADGVQLGRTTASFAVARQSLEMASTGRNRHLLQDIARASGGAYFDAESLPGPAYDIKMASFKREFRLDPRRSAWLLVIAALLAGLEWVLRRRRGLM